MKAKKFAIKPKGNRQSAYVARNRAAIIKAAQEVLAEIGPKATVEQIADHAQISTTTLYKYFENKEVLFSEALNEIWQNWVIWAYNGNKPGESLETFIDTTRKLFWVKQTHPIFAKILHNVLDNPTFMIIYNFNFLEIIYFSFFGLRMRKQFIVFSSANVIHSFRLFYNKINAKINLILTFFKFILLKYFLLI